MAAPHPFWMVVAACLLGCGDPVINQEVAALGPEAPGVRRGPLHRPGQPCLACHEDGGEASPAFSLAGTIFREKGSSMALGGVSVVVRDATGTDHTFMSNCAGNFYVTAADFMPAAPFWVTLRAGGQTIDMESPMFREGSCAACHTDPISPRSAGAVYMTDDPEIAKLLPATTCDGQN